MNPLKLLSLLIIGQLLVACASQSTSSKRINNQLSFTKIAPDTYVVTDETFHHSNVLVSLMPAGSVVVASSPFETQGADALMSWIKQKFKPKKIIAINTHFHADGTGGNEAYKKHGANIWANELTRNIHREKGEQRKKIEASRFESPELKKRIMDRRIVVAQNTFKKEKGLKLDFKNESVQVIWPGPAHTVDNVVVFLPKRKVLFGGCMIKHGDSIGNVADADLDRWEDSARSLLSLDAEIVIPGHGKHFGGEELIQNSIDLAIKAREAKNIAL